MNYCRIYERLNLPSKTVRDLFSGATAAYYDLATCEFVDDNRSYSTIPIKQLSTDTRNLELCTSTLSNENFDEYTNRMTQLSWDALSHYLQMTNSVVSLDHAAFIIDIADRNCLPVGEPLKPQLLAWRFTKPMFISEYALWRGFNRDTYMDTINIPIYKALRVGYHKDAFVRV